MPGREPGFACGDESGCKLSAARANAGALGVHARVLEAPEAVARLAERIPRAANQPSRPEVLQDNPVQLALAAIAAGAVLRVVGVAEVQGNWCAEDGDRKPGVGTRSFVLLPRLHERLAGGVSGRAAACRSDDEGELLRKAHSHNPPAGRPPTCNTCFLSKIGNPITIVLRDSRNGQDRATMIFV